MNLLRLRISSMRKMEKNKDNKGNVPHYFSSFGDYLDASNKPADHAKLVLVTWVSYPGSTVSQTSVWVGRWKLDTWCMEYCTDIAGGGGDIGYGYLWGKKLFRCYFWNIVSSSLRSRRIKGEGGLWKRKNGVDGGWRGTPRPFFSPLFFSPISSLAPPFMRQLRRLCFVPLMCSLLLICC